MLLFIMLPTAQGKVVSFFKFHFAFVNKFLWWYIRNFHCDVLVSAICFILKFRIFRAV